MQYVSNQRNDAKTTSLAFSTPYFFITNKSLTIIEMTERLNALFDVLEETANIRIGKKIGNLFTDKQ